VDLGVTKVWVVDFGTVLTVLATGLVTLSGVALTQVLTGRRERRAREQAIADAKDAATQAATREVAKLFEDEAALARKAIQHDEEVDDDQERWSDHWFMDAAPRLMLGIEGIPSTTARIQLMVISDALGDRMYSTVSGEPRLHVVLQLSELGRSIAATYMRGEEPSAESTAKVDAVQTILNDVSQYRQEKVGLEHEERST
jgi:hypothetical protein